MSENKQKLPLIESLRLNGRACAFLFRQVPMVFLSNIAQSVFSALTPYVGIYLSARLIDELAGERNPEKLVMWVLWIIGTALVFGISRAMIQRWKDTRNVAWWFHEIMIYARKMLHMDFCDMDNSETFKLYHQIMQNTRWTGWGLERIRVLFRQTLDAVLNILGAAALSVTLFTQLVPESAGEYTVMNHPLFIITMISVMMISVILSPMCAKKADSYAPKIAECMRSGNRTHGFFSELSSEQERAADIRIYNQEAICEHYFKTTNEVLRSGKLLRMVRGKLGLIRALGALISTLFTGVVYLFVCAKAWAGAFGVGAVTQYIGAMVALSGGITSLVSVLGAIQNNAYFLRENFKFLDIPNNMYQGSLTTEKRSDIEYEVEFRNVSFKYPGSDQYSLKNVSMKFKVGKRLAIVGQNGSGKTTFIKLLCRLYDPTEGQIFLNGIDIRKYKYDDYMNIFAVVFQDFQLLAFTLGENVAAGQEYDRAKAERCLRDAGFGERLDSLPKGLDTHLYRYFKEDGVEVSGGEAQKIAIARALYKDAPFIILDEPTAALDPIAEAEVYGKFDAITNGKTAIYISHRLSSCKFCDEIAVFHEGAVVQHGTHAELVADEKGKYHELWHAQAQYYVENETEAVPDI